VGPTRVKKSSPSSVQGPRSGRCGWGKRIDSSARPVTVGQQQRHNGPESVSARATSTAKAEQSASVPWIVGPFPRTDQGCCPPSRGLCSGARVGVRDSRREPTFRSTHLYSSSWSAQTKPTQTLRSCSTKRAVAALNPLANPTFVPGNPGFAAQTWVLRHNLVFRRTDSGLHTHTRVHPHHTPVRLFASLGGLCIQFNDLSASDLFVR